MSMTEVEQFRGHQPWPPHGGGAGGRPCSCGGNVGDCDCGADQCIPPWAWYGHKLRQCNKDIMVLRKLIEEIVNDILGNQPAPGGVTGPIIGVTDGSDAAPGEVGEFLTFSATGNYQAGAISDVILPVGIIPPGDWSLSAQCQFNTFVGVVWFTVEPTPPGTSAGLAAAMSAITEGGAEELVLLNTMSARGSYSVPTLMAFHINVNQTMLAGLPAGQVTLTLNARRVR